METKKRGTQEAQEFSCRRGVAALRKGLSRTPAAEACGVSSTAAHRWQKRPREAGHKTLASRTRGRKHGEPRRLSATQEAPVRRWSATAPPSSCRCPSCFGSGVRCRHWRRSVASSICRCAPWASIGGAGAGVASVRPPALRRNDPGRCSDGSKSAYPAIVEQAGCEVPIGCSCGEDLERWGCEYNTQTGTTAA